VVQALSISAAKANTRGRKWKMGVIGLFWFRQRLILEAQSEQLRALGDRNLAPSFE
jgi:hypothetical protein